MLADLVKFEDWSNDHFDKLSKVFEKFEENTPVNSIVDYFDYENISKSENGFCPLYRDYTKCHQTEKLNCLLCSCPHFRYSDITPLSVREDGIKVMSMCSIGSKDGRYFISDGIAQCDCSECILPHKNGYIKNITKDIQDAYSLLDWIRSYQLSNIFKV